jgi:hypothetical protein
VDDLGSLVCFRSNIARTVITSVDIIEVDDDQSLHQKALTAAGVAFDPGTPEPKPIGGTTGT